VLKNHVFIYKKESLNIRLAVKQGWKDNVGKFTEGSRLDF